MESKSIRFNNASTKNREFSKVLHQKVEEYFKKNNKSKHANTEMVVKTIFMFLLFLVPYFLFLSGITTSIWGLIGLWALMGFGVGGIGLSVMHDANHGAYSKYPFVNALLSKSLNFVGALPMNWKIQHNYLHHTYTNIEGHDEDIAPAGLLRFSPHAEYKKIHKYQWLYAWLFYSLMTFTWIINKEYGQVIKYNKMGLLEKHKTTLLREFFNLILTKIIYFGYIIVVPLLVTDFNFLEIFLGFFVMHAVAGFILAVIFQPAHVLPENDFPYPEDGKLDNNWFVHQLHTTANFARNNRVLSWYVGGLNHQIEHHMFPNICHVHYRDLSYIVEATAKEFGYPYVNFKTFRGAIIAHGKMLKKLGVPNKKYSAVRAA